MTETYIDQGMNGRVYETQKGVMKVQKRNSLGHDIVTQKRLHRYAQTLVDELRLKTLYVPYLIEANTTGYEMERINTQKIIYLGDPNHGHILSDEQFEAVSDELALLWKQLFQGGFAAWDFELFLQPNGKVALIDFDKFGFRMTSGPTSIIFPQTKSGSRSLFDIRYLFQNPCFPHDFVERLRTIGFEPPADCLPTRKN